MYRSVFMGVIVAAGIAVGCVRTSTLGDTKRSATNVGRAPSAPRAEYAELRWEVGPTTRSVTLERPGDQFKGVWFGNAMDHIGLQRPMPSNTRLPTSSDLLTMLSTQGWELVTHAMLEDRQVAEAPLHTEVWTLKRVTPRD